MPRWLPIVLITSVASIASSWLCADDKSNQDRLAKDKAYTRDQGPAPQLGGRLSRIREERAREGIPSADRLIYERARRRAQERAALLESYRWAGYSPTRPTIPYGYYGEIPHQRLYKPWVSAYFNDRRGW